MGISTSYTRYTPGGRVWNAPYDLEPRMPATSGCALLGRWGKDTSFHTAIPGS